MVTSKAPRRYRSKTPSVSLHTKKTIFFYVVAMLVSSAIVGNIMYMTIYMKLYPPPTSQVSGASRCRLYNEKSESLVRHCIRTSPQSDCKSRVKACLDGHWTSFLIADEPKSRRFRKCLERSNETSCSFAPCFSEACSYVEQPPSIIEDVYDPKIDNKTCSNDFECGCGTSYCCKEGVCRHCEFKCDDYCPWYSHRECLFTRCRDKSCEDVDINTPVTEQPVSIPVAEEPVSVPVEDVDPITQPVGGSPIPEPPVSEPVSVSPVAEPVSEPITPPVPIFIEEEEEAVCTKDEDCGCNDKCCVDGKCSPCNLCSDDCMYCVGEYCHDISC